MTKDDDENSWDDARNRLLSEEGRQFMNDLDTLGWKIVPQQWQVSYSVLGGFR